MMFLTLLKTLLNLKAKRIGQRIEQKTTGTIAQIPRPVIIVSGRTALSAITAAAAFKKYN